MSEGYREGGNDPIGDGMVMGLWYHGRGDHMDCVLQHIHGAYLHLYGLLLFFGIPLIIGLILYYSLKMKSFSSEV